MIGHSSGGGVLTTGAHIMNLHTNIHVVPKRSCSGGPHITCSHVNDSCVTVTPLCFVGLSRISFLETRKTVHN